MFKSLEYQPKKRSAFRVFLGTCFYRTKRYIEWLTSNETFTKTRESDLKQHVIHSHRTPLYRKLKDVDMWYQDNKVKNLKIAVRELDKVVIRPGETFSYWKLLGNTTKRKGYVNGMEWNGMEWNGMEWNGMEWNGMEWNGMEWNGMEWNGMEWNGMEWNGMEWNGMEWNGMEWNGMEWNGMEWNGMEWNGMEWNGMEWNGMEWNGMEWNGMEWNGMEWNGKKGYMMR
ncbi:VanW family protein [Rossellomorea sp. NS-SX7]|uniref:VanW family protein n=1 Tax=Rossellomorea sp. NS-SX7 TaxID=3463856 RepID=UPI00405998DF